MSRIRISNFGPIKKNDCWIEVGKVTMFVGNQGAGKSSVAKLISTFVWMEKSLNRQDASIKHFARKSRFKNTYLAYHRIQNYLRDDTEIEYVGDSYSFLFRDNMLSITKQNDSVGLPQIMYVPAERNFLTYIESFKELKVSSPSLREFRDEYRNAQKTMKGQYKLPIENTVLEYDRLNDIMHLRGNDYKLRISEASSGFQSFVPLWVVTEYLGDLVSNGSQTEVLTEAERDNFKRLVADVMDKKELSDQQYRDMVATLTRRYKKTAFINIVEEPEQNLFPSSQFDVLAGLLRVNNQHEGNKLIMTTHSPYLINYLSLFIKAGAIKNKAADDEVLTQLNDVIPLDAALEEGGVFVYELSENGGLYRRLDTYDGMPSDENLLNNGLAESNEKFAKLLDLEDLCR